MNQFPPRSPDSETILLRTAEQRGILSHKKVDEALRTRQTMTEADLALDLADVLFERGIVSRDQRDALRGLAAETTPGSDATERREADPRVTPITLGGVASAPDTGPPGEPFGRYRLVDQLGHGGMGVVWKAWDSDLRRIVALKQILAGETRTEQQLERFLREARAAARLRHPNVVAVYDVGEFDGKNYLTADFIDGTSLDRRMRDGEVSTREALSLAKTIAEALQYAHEQGIVHRDIKPANILLDRAGKPYVTDFGLAKDASPGSGPALTLSGDLLGTPSYMSPEQAMGRPDLQGPASDQFSLGVMLYELVTGALPFRAPGMQELLNSITDSDPIPPTRLDRKVHPDVETVILKAMEKDPAKRYPSMAELAADLGRILDAEPILARRPSVGRRILRRVTKHSTLAVAVVVAMVVGGTLGLLAWKKHQAGKEAEEKLRHAGAAQAVVRRWVDLARDLAAIEEVASDATLDAAAVAERTKGPRAAVERFMRETPPDVTSQATMKALAGWARHLAGRHDEGIAWIREAAAVDPEVPYPACMEALVRLDEFLSRWPPPAIPLPDCEYRVPPAPEPPKGLAEEAAQLDEMVARSLRGTIPDEGLAADLRRALEGVRALRAGRADEAERDLGSIVSSPALSVFATVFHEGRARALAAAGRFSDADGEWAQVIGRRPRMKGVYVSIGEVLARHAWDRAPLEHDTRERLGDAVRCFTQAITIGDDLPRAHVHRGVVLCLWAEQEDTFDGAWQEAYERGIEDFSRGLEWPTSEASARFDRAQALFDLAEVQARRGEDPSQATARATEDIDRLLRVAPNDDGARALRARIDWKRAAAAEGPERVDLRRKALERVREAIRVRPDRAWYHVMAGGILLDLAMIEEIEGDDAMAGYRAAVAELGEAARGDPKSEQAFLRRGNAWLQIGRMEAARGADPRPSWEKAIADERAAIAIDTYAGEPHGILAGVLTEMGRLEEAVREYEQGIKNAKDSEWMKERLAPLKQGLEAYERQGTEGWRRTLDIAATALASGDGPTARVVYEIGIEEAIVAQREERLASLSATQRDLERMCAAHRDLGKLYAQLVVGRSSREGKAFTPTEEEKAGFRERAFKHLQNAVAFGWRDAKAAQEDADLAPLREDPRWETFVRGLQGK